MNTVVIGADPHKRSVTIEVLDEREWVLHQGRYGTDRDGYRQTLAAARQFEQRSWAVEGCNGTGRHVAQRLVGDGETVLDVPAKLAARARLFDTGNGRTSDPADAHSVAVVALRTQNLIQVRVDDELVALRFAGRPARRARPNPHQTVNRLHRLLLELVPGGVKRFLTAAQAHALLDNVAPTDVAGRVRHQLATELLGEVVVLDKKMYESDKTLRKAVAATGTGLTDLFGIGPAGAARILGDAPTWPASPPVPRFASRNGTAQLGASSGEQTRHRLSRAGNRRINRALHIMAVVQIRHNTPGRAYLRRRLPAGKTRWRHCGPSSDDSPMWCTGSWSPTRVRRAREDTWGRLRHPARPTQPRRSALRTSHSPGFGTEPTPPDDHLRRPRHERRDRIGPGRPPAPT